LSYEIEGQFDVQIILASCFNHIAG
jgi:hypothetical protein